MLESILKDTRLNNKDYFTIILSPPLNTSLPTEDNSIYFDYLGNVPR
jgi:hypothetical protein